MKRTCVSILLVIYLISILAFPVLSENAGSSASDYSSGIEKIIDLFEENGKNILGITLYTINQDSDGVKCNIIAQKSTNVFVMSILHNSIGTINLYLSGSGYDKEGLYAIRREHTTSTKDKVTSLGYVNPEQFYKNSTEILDLVEENGNDTYITETYKQDTVRYFHELLSILQSELDALNSNLSLADIGFINYNTQSETTDNTTLTESEIILLDNFIEFVHNNPYPSKERDYSKEDCVDKQLILKYQERIDALKDAGIADVRCPEIEYGKLVVSLEKYIDDISYVRAFSATKKFFDDAEEKIMSAGKSASAGKHDLVYSSFTAAAAKYEAARDIIDLYDQNEYRIAELRDCFQHLYSGTTNSATGFYTKSLSLYEIGEEILQEGLIQYYAHSAEVTTIVKNINTIEAKLTTLQ